MKVANSSPENSQQNLTNHSRTSFGIVLSGRSHVGESKVVVFVNVLSDLFANKIP